MRKLEERIDKAFASIKITRRDQDIFRKFREGKRYEALAKKYDLSVSRISAIVRGTYRRLCATGYRHHFTSEERARLMIERAYVSEQRFFIAPFHQDESLTLLDSRHYAVFANEYSSIERRTLPLLSSRELLAINRHHNEVLAKFPWAVGVRRRIKAINALKEENSCIAS